MFANLKKKIESEVGDLSRLTPNLRSITQSEKLTPLSSRQNSVSSLASETSYSNSNKVTSSPLSPFDQFHNPPFANSGKTESGNQSKSENQIKLKRAYEEKLQTQELDFAWRLNSKDDEITKLQKQVDHLSSLLHSKEFETQQKLVRVQEDMDSLEGFSQQENAKIKHLLLNREEELSQLRAAVMHKDSTINEFESQIKNITVENDRLKKSLDEVVGRSGNKIQSAEESEKNLKSLQDRIKDLETERSTLEITINSNNQHVEKLQNDLLFLKQNNESMLDNVRKENSLVLKELKDLTSKFSKQEQDIQSQCADIVKLENELSSSKDIIVSKDSALKDAIALSSKEEALKLKSLEELNQLRIEVEKKDCLVSDLENKLRSSENSLSDDNRNLSESVMNLEKFLREKDETILKFQNQIDELASNESDNNQLLLKELKDVTTKLNKYEKDNNDMQGKISKLENQLSVSNDAIHSKESALKDAIALATQKEETLKEKNLEEKNQLVVEMKNKDSIISDLKEKVSSMDNKLAETVAMAANVKEKTLKVKSLEEELLNLRSDIKTKNSIISDLEEKATTTRNKSAEENSTLSKSVVELENRLKQKDQSISKLQNHFDELKSIESNHNDLKKNLKDVTFKMNQLEEENIDLRALRTKLENELTISKENMDSKESALKEAIAVANQEKILKTNSLDELNQLRAEINNKDSIISELDEKLNNAGNKLEEALALAGEHETLKTKSAKELNELFIQIENKDSIISNLEEKLNSTGNQIAEEYSNLSKTVVQLEELLKDKNESISKLQIHIDELTSIESDNNDLVLQISEIQSKCDELEEENKFLKESSQPDDYEQIKKRVGELEGEMVEKTQMLKQQSHQLQDLRRSLAKEINKNQTISDSAASSRASPVSFQSQCNGATSPNATISVSTTVVQPPTLPPQETDVNFMYLRSVLFKYLTTTDVQVTQQLTRVVATLLHLSDEEAHILSQAAESKNGFFHLTSKS